MAAGVGTAPVRRSPGVWVTRAGSRLTPAQAAVWEGYYRTGRTDGRGHFHAPSVVQIPPPPKPVFAPTTSAKQSPKPPHVPFQGLQTGRQSPQVKRGERAAKQARAQTDYQVNQALFGGNYENVLAANKTINPAVGNVLNSLSPLTATLAAGHALQHHNLLGAAGAALGIVPFGPGKFLKGAKDAIEAEQALTAGEQVLSAATAAKRLLPATRALQRAERARKAELIGPAHEAAGGGQAGHYASKAALRGELPSLTFDRLAHFDQATMDELHNAVQKLPDFRPYEKLSLREALDRMQAGKPPRDFEIQLIKRAFGPKAAAEAESTIPLHQQILTGAAEVANIPRAVMASADVSGAFRQALLFAAHDPVTFAKNLGPMFHMLVSENRYKELLTAIHADPHYEDAVKSGLKLTELGSLDKREEAFMSNLAEKITGVGPLIGKPAGTYSFVRGSGRAYTGLLDSLRMAGYKNLVEGARAAGVSEERMPKLMRDAANFINVSTGRGGLGKLEPAAVALNSVLFSPRLFASRVQAFNPVFYAGLDPFVRKQAMAATFKMVAAGSTILGLAALAGAKVVSDPTNADFGKIRIGNTRFDIWGGHQQLARLISQIAEGKVTSSTTGQVTRLVGGHALSRQDIVKRFFEGKLAPTPSLINDWFRGTDFQGKPFSWKKEFLSRIWPLVIQDAVDVANQANNPWAGLGAYGIGALGVGVQSYGPKPVSRGPGIEGNVPDWVQNRGGANLPAATVPDWVANR